MLIVSIGTALCFLGLFVLIMRARRRFKPGSPDRTNYDFEIAQLVKLRHVGRISEDEFERARVSVLSRKDSEPVDATKRGFEPLLARKPMIQSLEDRISP